MSTTQVGFMPTTERIELPDGQWWEIISEPTRGMRKVFRTAGIEVGGDALKLAASEDLLGDDEARQQFLMKHATELKLDALDDAFLLHGTAKWSFDMEVTVANIDSLPDKFTAPVLARMNECYQVDQDEEKKD